MTGGSLPAMTWQKAMAYAHSGLEPRPLIGLEGAPLPQGGAPKVAATGSDGPPARRPTTLSPRSGERLLKSEELRRKAPPLPGRPAPMAAQPDRRAATESPAPAAAR